MESLPFQIARGDEESIECWDDDGELQCSEDYQFPTVSRATSVTNSSARRLGHRDSFSSRRSARSDIDSNVEGDEDWEIDLHENDELANEKAVASVKGAGIPLPANIPKSALVGGTIKRLGGRKRRRDFMHDWAEDLEFPDPEDVLELKHHAESTFPESLQHLSSTVASPVKSRSPLDDDGDAQLRLQFALTKLSEFRDKNEPVHVSDTPTVRVGKPKPLRKAAIASDLIKRPKPEIGSFDRDFELPMSASPLKLPERNAKRRTRSPTPEDFDVDWCESSIGVRFGGTTRDRRSNPSSSISAVSPTISSCLSAASDDDCLDGLILPDGRLPLDTYWKRHRGPTSTDTIDQRTELQPSKFADDVGDFFSGIEIQDGRVFIDRKLSLNPNVKYKTERRPYSPARRSATTITFTESTSSPKTRIPRPPSHIHSQSACLETVSEAGASLSSLRPLPSHPIDHIHSSSTSGPPRTLPMSVPTRLNLNWRLTGTRTSREAIETSSGHTDGRTLRSKRSMPAMRNSRQSLQAELPQGLSACPGEVDRASATSDMQLFTPIDRTGAYARTLGRRLPGPFIPVGLSGDQSKYPIVKGNGRPYTRNADGSSDMASLYSSVPRMPKHNTGASTNMTKSEATLPFARPPLVKATRRQIFGDGTELESFDDLHTSSVAESRFIKSPTGRGAPRWQRVRPTGNQRPQTAEKQGQQQTPATVVKMPDPTPRFARDTNASRNAREQRIGSMSALNGRAGISLAPISTSWKPHGTTRAPHSPTLTRKRKTKTSPLHMAKPQLIKPIEPSAREIKSVNGMHYNPATLCWEGNEKSVQDFDMVSPKHIPALITNAGKIQNARVVGGMVFDPRSMSWRTLAPFQPGPNGQLTILDEDDVFAGLDDLEEAPKSGALRVVSDALDDLPTSADDQSGDSSDDLPITEEFDVGPEFIRRQRAEEEKWRRKTDQWTSAERTRLENGWRWAIRDLVRFNSASTSSS